jgi:hypothetical protein
LKKSTARRIIELYAASLKSKTLILLILCRTGRIDKEPLSPPRLLAVVSLAFGTVASLTGTVIRDTYDRARRIKVALIRQDLDGGIGSLIYFDTIVIHEPDQGFQRPTTQYTL